ncbi:rRNA maturation RNase YbeY [Lacisediminimonas profundi]|uniref:rRNA maturation RNase YbeY n=1 Tax=Lacisediminimonas profundi TaxID=2603856 RepID=UPI00124BC1C8|nr:rRNA maturation RNase YbeY [Lacisediminimonas profundi]
MASRSRHPLSLSVQYADARLKDAIARPAIRRWVQAALLAPAELTIRFVDAEEGRVLNRDYRGKDYATNVLTFAYSETADEAVVQADIILCSDVLEREAAEQGIGLADHAAHLVVHGVLHAQGYDHEDDDEAAEMEQLETEILATLGLPDPYRER